MKKHLRISTGIVMIGALAAPAPAMAQSVNLLRDRLDPCSEGTAEQPCLLNDETVRLADGTEIPIVEALDLVGDVIVLPGPGNGNAVDQSGGQGGEVAETDAAADAAADAEDASPAEAESAADASGDAAASANGDTQATDGETRAPQAGEDAAPVAEPQGDAQTDDASASGGSEVSDDVTVSGDPAAMSGAPASGDVPQTDDAEAPAAAADAEAGAEEPSAAASEVPGDESEPDQMTDGADDAVPSVEATEAEVAAETPADISEMTEQDLNAQAAAEAQAEARAAEESAAAAAAGPEAAAETVTETITEADTRSSSQEFETTATGSGEAADRGLSTLEKVLLLGAGAAVVGTLLNNGDRVVSSSGDRVVVDRDGQLVVLRDDDTLLRQPGNEVQTQTFSDGSTRNVVTRPDGSRVITVRAPDGRVLRRTKIEADGTEYVLFDDTRTFERVDVSDLPRPAERAIDYGTDEDALREALAATARADIDRSFSLSQIRNIRAVRELAPEIELENVTFGSGSASLSASEAKELSALGRAMRDRIEENPREVFLVEGHTDAVGDATYNLALSDRRAESLALALTEYFDVPPENMVIQGYGERYLKVPTAEAERRNRRAVVRVITPLLGEVVASNR